MLVGICTYVEGESEVAVGVVEGVVSRLADGKIG